MSRKPLLLAALVFLPLLGLCSGAVGVLAWKMRSPDTSGVLAAPSSRGNGDDARGREKTGRSATRFEEGIFRQADRRVTTVHGVVVGMEGSPDEGLLRQEIPGLKKPPQPQIHPADGSSPTVRVRFVEVPGNAGEGIATCAFGGEDALPLHPVEIGDRVSIQGWDTSETRAERRHPVLISCKLLSHQKP